MKRVTRVEQNRRDRHKKLLKAKAEAEKVEALSKEIDRYSDMPTWISSISVDVYMVNYVWFAGCSLPEIIQEIAKEDEERHRRHQRRIVAKQERLKTRPPRLGKHKYVPER